MSGSQPDVVIFPGVAVPDVAEGPIRLTAGTPRATQPIGDG
jgi:hypothetical protein